MSPVSISPWQFAHTRTHFLASSWNAASDFPRPMFISNDFWVGST